MNQIFFSYATEDRNKVQRFAEAFQEQGTSVLIDHQQIRPGASISGGINQMIIQSNGAVIFYSSEYARKPWTSEEQDALMYRSTTISDYQLLVVRLDLVADLPPLLAHRLWSSGADANALASAFSQNLRQALGAGPATKVIPNWAQTFSDDDLERMALTVKTELQQHPSATMVRLRSKRAGELVVHLAQPLVRKLLDTLISVLRIQEKISLIRNDLREQLMAENTGLLRGAFILEEREKVAQIENIRIELRESLDAIVEQVTLA